MVSLIWIFKIKHVAYSHVEKHKARFMVRGFSKNVGVDYEETFAPIARYTYIKVVTSISLEMGWRMH